MTNRAPQVTVGGIQFDLKLTLLIILVTLVPMINIYWPAITGRPQMTGETAYDRFLLFFAVPVLFVVAWRDRLSDYGFRIGNWREGMKWIAVVCPVMVLVLWLFTRQQTVQYYYQPPTDRTVWRIIWLSGVELFGWEFLWRGLFLFALARVVSPGTAIFLQAIPFACFHMGKPAVETLSTIFGGAGFGFVAWRTQSFAYAWLIHWFILVLTILMVAP